MGTSPSRNLDRRRKSPKEAVSYLRGGSRLGNRCHWLLSAASSSTDTAEVAAMPLQPQGSLTPRRTPGASRAAAAAHTPHCKTSAPLSSFCPPRATVWVKTLPIPVWWASPPPQTNQKQNRASVRRLANGATCPRRCGPGIRGPAVSAPTPGGVARSSPSRGPEGSDRPCFPPLRAFPLVRLPVGELPW